MAKIIKLDPINQETLVKTNDNLLSGLLNHELKILHECGGRGMCATCHVFIKEGMESLSPMTHREQRTLSVITTCNGASRLACQARVLQEGITVELPSGVYANAVDEIESWIGQRAQQNILHPLSGQVLVEQGKLVTRSMMRQLQEGQRQISQQLMQAQ